jgi:beta-phosphoglucomutase-like phosphatase (HAD superfamily)
VNLTDPTGTHIFEDAWNGVKSGVEKGRRFAGVAQRVNSANGLACYVRKSAASDDTNRVSDDVGDAVNCLNPINGFTGDVGGTDD